MNRINMPLLVLLAMACPSLALGSGAPDNALPEYLAAEANDSCNLFPSSFRGTGEHSIVDTLGLLAPIAKRLELVRTRLLEDTVSIVHVGDSHVRGRIFPGRTATKLANTFGAVKYSDIGINGATCATFASVEWVDSIKSLKPELLILSFGTNESYTRRYDAQKHYQTIDSLVRLLRAAMPEVPILLTTPPGSFFRYRQRRRKRVTYSVNPNTARAAETIKLYAQRNHLLLWDLYGIAGGEKNACSNWTRANLMRADRVHYLPRGYEIQGNLLYQALVKAFYAHARD